VGTSSDYCSCHREVYSSSKKPTLEPILSLGASVGFYTGLVAGMRADLGALPDQTILIESRVSESHPNPIN